jgi:hypothetical protein
MLNGEATNINTTQKTHSLVPFIEGCGGYYLTLLKIGTPLLPFQVPLFSAKYHDKNKLHS